jgi:hypothetical protein
MSKPADVRLLMCPYLLNEVRRREAMYFRRCYLTTACTPPRVKP